MRKQRELIERLNAPKPSHGPYKLCQDAIKEIQKCRRERDEAFAERTSLLDRIAQLKRVNAELNDRINNAIAA